MTEIRKCSYEIEIIIAAWNLKSILCACYIAIDVVLIFLTIIHLSCLNTESNSIPKKLYFSVRICSIECVAHV